MGNIHLSREIMGDYLIESDLLRQGYIILYKNYVFNGFKIDFITQKDGEIVIFHIRTRIGDSHFSDLEPSKYSGIISIAQKFLSGSERLRSKPWRMDIINISLDKRGKPYFSNHIKDYKQGNVSRETFL